MFIICTVFRVHTFKDFLNNYTNKSLNILLFILFKRLKINLPIKEFHIISVAFFYIIQYKINCRRPFESA